MKDVSKGMLEIMDSFEYERWEKAYESYPTLTEIILLYDNPEACPVQIKEQLNEILLCIDSNLSLDAIRHIANPVFSALQMEEVRLGFESGLDLEDIMMYAKPEFDGYQMREIRKAIQRKMSKEKIELILNPQFKYRQMQQIINGFIENCFDIKEVTVYADPKFDVNVMSVFRLALLSVDVKKLALIKAYNYTSKEIKQCIKNMSDYPQINLEYWKVLCNLSPVELATFPIIREANKGLSLDLVNALIKSNYSWECLNEILTNYKQFSEEEQEFLFAFGSQRDVPNPAWIKTIVNALKDGISKETIMTGAINAQDLDGFVAILNEVRKNKRIQRLNQLVNKKTE